MKVLVSEASRKWAHNLDDTLERWMLRHSVSDIPKVREVMRMSIDEVRERLTKIPKEQLLELKIEIDKTAHGIKYQQEVRYGRGEKWNEQVAENNEVKRVCTIYSQAIQAELSRRKSLRRETFGDIFIQVSRDLLDPNYFEYIKIEAYRRFKKQDS